MNLSQLRLKWTYVRILTILNCPYVKWTYVKCTMITINCPCLTGQLMLWCELNDLIECLTLNVRNLKIWEFLILVCFLKIDWGVLLPMMWSHVLCYSFLIWVCFEVWIVPFLLHETKVFRVAWLCLMRAHLCLVKINCFKPILFSWQHELTYSLKND